MLSKIKRLAADILGIGRNKVKVDPEKMEDAEQALTRADVKELLASGAITVKQRVGHTKTKKKAKKRRAGSRKGKKYSRKPRKEQWMEKVRAQRKLLKQLIEEGKVDKKYQRKIYMKIKGGSFKGKKAMLTFLKENNMLKE